MTAPRDIPGATASPSNTTTTAPTRNRANTFSYPRWDADGNSHHPPPDTTAAGGGGGAAASTSPRRALASSTSSNPPSSSILRLLGLSPPPASSGDNAKGHRRGASYSYSTSSTTSQPSSFASSHTVHMPSPFSDDDDGPPEPVTPPQQQLGQTQLQPQAKLTDYGHELDASHKLELDDVFDDSNASMSFAKSPPPSSTAAANNAIALQGAPLGRRASWSPAVIQPTAGHTYSSSPPAGPPPAVLSWLHGQQTSFPISSSQSHSGTAASTTTTTTSDTKDFGSSPVGLFRRLSLSVNRRPPPPPAPASTVSISEISDRNDKERIGRPLTKVTSAPPRRLSPMGERMLRAHYDSFS